MSASAGTVKAVELTAEMRANLLSVEMARVLRRYTLQHSAAFSGHACTCALCAQATILIGRVEL